MRVLLMILDGWGLSADASRSAIAQADTPFMDQCWAQYPHGTLTTSGETVGLPAGQMGNSEVGHMHIGAGRVVYQDLLRIHKEIEAGRFQEHTKLLRLFAAAKRRGVRIHLMGLFSDGGVHAHVTHLEALCEAAARQGIGQVYVHAFLDGRDMPPRSALELLERWQPRLRDLGAEIATCTGRYYAMDRDKRWSRTQQAYEALTAGKGTRYTHLPTALRTAYEQGIGDEFLPPHICTDDTGAPLAYLQKDDLLLCFNFRADRMRQLIEVLTQPTASQAHSRAHMPPLPLSCATMTSYDTRYTGLEVIYEKEDLSNTLGAVLADAHKTQLRIAETEKYPHVTFFFSGGQETPFVGETRILCPSPKVATYDLQPEMSAPEITTRLLAELQAKTHDFVCLNYANADMVGHTGSLEAAAAACACVDRCAARVVATARRAGYHVLIIADHGNAECMQYPDGSPHTAHTTNPVPAILIHAQETVRSFLPEATLVDVAPTVLKLMQIPQPTDMTGHSLYG